MFFLYNSLIFSKLSCKNPINKDIPWYSTFKIPVISDRQPIHATGLGFFYTDDATRLSESTSDLGNLKNNPVYNTLIPLYKNDPKIGYVLINDQPPEGTMPASRAHMKGIILFDDDNGLYIEHSTPRFPPDPLSGGYSYPSSGTKYGQSLLCVTLSHESLEIVSKGLLIDRPGVYASSLPSFTNNKIPTLQKVINQEWNTQDETLHQTLPVGSTKFEFFAKSGSWDKELYSDLIAPTLKARTYAATWSNGVGTLNSDCNGKYNTYNVLKVNFDGVEWTRSKDHSKWAVVGDYVCICGINRQASQTKRGGGCWCKKDITWARSMNNVISEFEQCP